LVVVEVTHLVTRDQLDQLSARTGTAADQKQLIESFINRHAPVKAFVVWVVIKAVTD
jgi:phage-related protein